MIGWKDIQVQEILSAKGRKQVPDALLFADADAKAKAGAEAQRRATKRDGRRRRLVFKSIATTLRQSVQRQAGDLAHRRRTM